MSGCHSRESLGVTPAEAKTKEKPLFPRILVPSISLSFPSPFLSH
jgi:hypothetical protein